ESYFRRAIVLRPDHSVARNGLAITLAQSGRLEEAAATFRDLIRQRPKDVDAYHNLGSLRTQQGQFDDPILHYRHALKIRPDYASAAANLKAALEQRSAQAERLSAQVRQSGSILDAAAESLNRRALWLIEQQQFDAARVLLQQALQLMPDHVDANINL